MPELVQSKRAYLYALYKLAQGSYKLVQATRYGTSLLVQALLFFALPCTSLHKTCTRLVVATRRLGSRAKRSGCSKPKILFAEYEVSMI